MYNETVPPQSIRPPQLEGKDLPETQEESPKKSRFKSILREILIFALVAFGIVLPFRIYVAEPYLVDGRSMDPTFETGDYLIVDKITKGAKEPSRGSVVVLEYPNDTSKSFIKRVIGLPGETIIIKGSVVTIVNAENPKGFELDEPYVKHPSQNFIEKKLAQDEYFVMGDNRAESFDSRSWGPLKTEYILGKPLLQLLPVNKIGFYPGSDQI